LPRNNLIYSLRELLGSDGSTSVWLGGAEVRAELDREYRKAAEQAAARGDWRRAAYIYGKLLHDFGRAATALERGGLHHDAAVIYLEKLGDTRGAARAFEAAGEVDRALQLYRRRGDYVAAGDLLRRAGEEDLALEEYRVAAMHLAEQDNHLAAGELLLERGRRPDLAREFFAAGWSRRPQGSAEGCLLRLLEMRAAEESPRELLILTNQAEDYFSVPGNDVSAGQFYNALARLAEARHLAAIRDDLRDRALTGLAYKLRRRAREESRPGNAVSLLLGQSGTWSPALVSDADFAFQAALGRPPAARSVPENRVRLGVREVTAVTGPPQGGAVFAGFPGGEWTYFDHAGRCFRGTADEGSSAAIQAMATDRLGRAVVILQAADADGRQVLTVHSACGSVFHRRGRSGLPATQGPAWLTPVVQSDGHAIVGLWHGGRLATLWAADLVPTGEIPVPSPVEELGAAVLLEPKSSGRPGVWLLFVGEELCYFAGDADPEAMPIRLGWRPGSYYGDLASPPPPSWQLAGGTLTLAGLGVEGSAQWTEVQLRGGTAGVVRAVSPRVGYLAAALLGPGRVAAVRRGGIEWLRRERGHLVPWAATRMDLPDAVACFPSPLTNELLVVCRDGWLVRVPVPH
jgi:tetratricopeptide (TPR) repeat protein